MLLKLYGAGLSTGKKYKHTHFTLSAGNYSINDFDGKAKKAVLQEIIDWEVT